MVAEAISSEPQRRLPSLDGWRAIAIVLVMLTHLTETNNFNYNGLLSHYLTVQGDFGVRIFFVLSGFLINYLLLLEYEMMGSISLRNFYVRRSLRIFPVYFAYLFVLLGLSFAGLYKDTLAAWIGAFTFTRDLMGQPISASGHFWSLAVEEQFYLLWPLTLVSFDLLRKKTLAIIILGAVVVGCFFARLHSCGDVPSLLCRTFFRRYSPLMYMDSIAVGCLTSFAVTSRKGGLGAVQLPKVVAWFCGISLLASTALIDVTDKLFASTIVSAQAFLIAICIVATVKSSSGIAYWFLNRRLVIELGLISYSLYVWHFMFLGYFMGDPLKVLPIFDWRVWWVPSLVIAYLSFHFFEKPVQRLKRKFERVKP